MDRILKIAEITVGDRFRKDLGDITALATSLDSIGLLHPVVVTTEHRLVAGRRRVEAAKSIGWDEIAVTVIDPEHMLTAEHDENECRKDFTTSERVAIAAAVQEQIGVKQGQRPTSGQMARSERPREEAAKAAGFESEQEYRRAKKVVENGTPELIEAMDEGKLPVSTAAKAADLPPKTQRKIAAAEEPAKAARAAVKKAEAKVEAEEDAAKVNPTEEFVGKINKLCHALDACKKDLKDLLADPLGKHIHGESITLQIDAARKALWQSRPTDPCNCVRNGAAAKPECRACFGTGICPAARVLKGGR